MITAPSRTQPNGVGVVTKGARRSCAARRPAAQSAGSRLGLRGGSDTGPYVGRNDRLHPLTERARVAH